MKISRSRCLILSFILLCGLVPEVTAEVEEASETLALSHITKPPVVFHDPYVLPKPVDNEKLHLDAEDIENLDATKLSRFIQMNNLHWVTEYNPLIAAGLFSTMIQTHLLLMMNKASPEYEQSVLRFQKAAKLFQGQVLFVLVDSGRGENRKVISYFKLKESQLPALAIYETVDDKWDTLPITEVTVEKVRDFCDGFQKRVLLRDHNAAEDAGKEEL
ncbi:endoplasmic reticulum resident protein 27 [Onychomys torridus]|uniref:endoplasmic reticulum resident protein 27 n=1 Tax=Onychomys torridus TaxID=38674 RepID=UPI00167FCE17|nr:endoplasmic reticulum resident protein 27 [Onychomys torridus]